MGEDCPHATLTLIRAKLRRLREIVTQIGELFQEDGSSTVPHHADPNNMSLDEKMDMWESKADSKEPIVGADKPFEGVRGSADIDDCPDDNDFDANQITTTVSLSAYNQVIQNSAAFHRLISRLRSVAQNSTEQGTLMRHIRQSILEGLPTGTISKRRQPTDHSVTFQFPLGMRDSLVQTHNDDFDLRMGAFRLGWFLSDYIVFTGSSTRAQATTIAEYSNQTWPVAGMTILEIMQRAIRKLSEGPFLCCRLGFLSASLVSQSPGI